MGIIAKSFFLGAALLFAAWLTALLERRFLRDEAGPARSTASGRYALANRDRWLFPIGLSVALMGIFLGAVVIPFSPSLIGKDLGIGVFYFIVVLDFVTLAVALTAWGANTPHAVEACYRVVAQLIAYVVPMGMAIVGAIMMARSLSTSRIIEAQSGLWFIVLQPLGFMLYVVTGLMQCYRAPFLEPFAEDIEGGVLGVVGGAVGLAWRCALSGLLFLVAAMGAILFLGGWSGPWLAPSVWMGLKTFALMALMLVLGRKCQPLGIAGMLALSWKVLIPLGLVNVLIVGVLILLKIGPI